MGNAEHSAECMQTLSWHRSRLDLRPGKSKNADLKSVFWKNKTFWVDLCFKMLDMGPCIVLFFFHSICIILQGTALDQASVQ